MKYLLKLTVCLGLILNFQFSTVNSVQAQITHSAQGDVDQKAAAVLKKAAARFDQNVAFTVEVTLLDAQHKESLRQSAQVLYDKGRYRLTVSGQEVVCDGTTVWQWNKAAREVVVSNMGSDDVDLMNPARLLSNYGKSFRAKYIRTDDDGSAVIDLQPRSARSFHKIRLLVNEKDGTLKRMEVHKYDSGRELYDISGFRRASTPASQFTFDAAKHPDVEVIDMR